mmetsp:Transcript_35948/g.78688  ORF Transcript_35948/g.78688 Transcript_35948/m.78688 type:complete len:341 (-) Transcript_35948:49-1071(-)|eukprot:CAMPEP_0170593372 /NCGR_PEP_ID=MMETSP0224-20130122/13412_1 /TAXON_ID=285029 /ORGANISM="Togula jolla, Strain CCCM 725" /LENGTH=340 /DNA_ID=CAMNT_0010917319 /DNA_START=76 /DNA_END=1098 /DNA_ORIENTATION=+
MAVSRILTLLLVALDSGVARATQASKGNPNKYLIVSSSDGRILYSRIARKGLRMSQVNLQELIKMPNGSIPMGLAVDNVRNELLVADPTTRNLFAYRLEMSRRGDTLSLGSSNVRAEGIEFRWVSVDTAGNAYFSDESGGRILRISAEQARAQNTTPEVVYDHDASLLTELNHPGGVAVDSFQVYWANTAGGTQVGSIIKAPLDSKSKANSAKPVMLSQVAEVSESVCLAMKNLFFTLPGGNLYGVPTAGGSATLITNRLRRPAGCAFDGDGTVFVADNDMGGIYSFAGNMQTLSEAVLVKTASLDLAYGVAVYSGTLSLRPSVWLMMAIALALTGSAFA